MQRYKQIGRPRYRKRLAQLLTLSAPSAVRVVPGSVWHNESPVSIERIVLGQIMLSMMLLIRSSVVCPLTAPVIVAAGIRLDLRYDYLDQKQYRSGSNKTSKSAFDSQEKEVEDKTTNHYMSQLALIIARVEIGVLIRSLILIARSERVVAKLIQLRLIAVLSPLFASEVVFVKMPSRQQKRRAKRRDEYLQNQTS